MYLAMGWADNVGKVVHGPRHRVVPIAEVIEMTGRNATAFPIGAVRSIGFAAVVIMVVAAAACSFDIGGIEFHFAEPDEFARPQESRAIPFTTSGQPAADGVVCDHGSVTTDRLESTVGKAISHDDWAAEFGTAMTEEGVAEVYLYQTFECGDGSGSFSMKIHNTFDFSSFEFAGEQDVGRWQIEEGTESYADLSGSGDVTISWDEADVKYEGDVR